MKVIDIVYFLLVHASMSSSESRGLNFSAMAQIITKKHHVYFICFLLNPRHIVLTAAVWKVHYSENRL